MNSTQQKRLAAALEGVDVLTADPDQVYRDKFADEIDLHTFRAGWERARGAAKKATPPGNDIAADA